MILGARSAFSKIPALNSMIRTENIHMNLAAIDPAPICRFETFLDVGCTESPRFLKSPTLGASKRVVCASETKNNNCQADGIQLLTMSCGGPTSFVTYKFLINIRFSST